MVVIFHNLNSLNEYLSGRRYITGDTASMDDIYVFCKISKPISSDYPNVSNWHRRILAQLLYCDISWRGQGVKFQRSTSDLEKALATPPVTDTKASVAADGDDDLFGEEIEEKNKAAEEHATTTKASLCMKLLENFRSSCSAILNAILKVARKFEKEKQC